MFFSFFHFSRECISWYTQHVTLRKLRKKSWTKGKFDIWTFDLGSEPWVYEHLARAITNRFICFRVNGDMLVRCCNHACLACRPPPRLLVVGHRVKIENPPVPGSTWCGLALLVDWLVVFIFVDWTVGLLIFTFWFVGLFLCFYLCCMPSGVRLVC